MKSLNSEIEITASHSEETLEGRETMIRKRGLQDVKRRNRQVVLQSILESGSLSRVEIAQKTELAPSTVSALVSELMAQGLLAESGSRTTTAGRSRTGLVINPNFGFLAVIEVSRKRVTMNCYDMALEPIGQEQLLSRHLCGNDLLDTIAAAIASQVTQSLPLAGIGLLFQEDMRDSDFRVMYSTGFNAASITLREALLTQFRVPVVEDYSQTYTVSQALGEQPDPAVRDSAHIALGSSVLVSVTMEDRPLPLRGDFYQQTCQYLEDLVPETQPGILSRRLSQMITLLCMMFSLNTVFLSGLDSQGEGLLSQVEEALRQTLPEESIPQLRLLHPKKSRGCRHLFAQRIRQEILLTR